MQNKITTSAASLLLLVLWSSAQAGSATWKLNPISGDWNTAVNWTPATVPNGSADTALFDLSNTTGLSISADTEVNGIVFDSNAGLNPFTITASPGFTLTISDVGITNNSGTTQNFVTAVDGAGNRGQIVFRNSATAGTATMFTNNGASVNGTLPAGTWFLDTSSAGNGTFINKGGAVSGSVLFQGGGFTAFSGSSTAGNGSFTNDGGIGGVGGQTLFFDASTGGNGTFINNGGTTAPGSTEFFNSSSASNGTFTNKSGPFFAGFTRFSDTSTAGNGVFTNNGGTISNLINGGETSFRDSSTAGDATIMNNGALASNAGFGETIFFNTSSAGTATIINNGGTVNGAQGGQTEFFAFVGAPTAGSATIINNGGTVNGAQGGSTDFFAHAGAGAPTAANATIINNGATVSGAAGGSTIFGDSSTAASAILVANSGSNGGAGGTIVFADDSTGGTSRVEVFGDGTLDISLRNAPHFRVPAMTVGSIEGDGRILLGANNLSVGNNNLNTVFSGVIQDGGMNGGAGGSLTKVGSGTLVLAGVNTYSGDTTIKQGVLQVDGSISSNTFVRRGASLSGTGIIDGSVISNNIVGPGAGTPGALTINGNYTQLGQGVLMIDIAGTNSGQVSLLDVLGSVALRGRLDPVLQNDFVPLVGEQFVFLKYASRSGRLLIDDPTIEGTMDHWKINYEPGQAILTVAAGGVPDHGSTFLLLTLSLLGLAGLQANLRRS